MHLIPTLRSKFQTRVILAITSIHFPRFLEMIVMDTVIVMSEAILVSTYGRFASMALDPVDMDSLSSRNRHFIHVGLSRPGFLIFLLYL